MRSEGSRAAGGRSDGGNDEAKYCKIIIVDHGWIDNGDGDSEGEGGDDMKDVSDVNDDDNSKMNTSEIGGDFQAHGATLKRKEGRMAEIPMEGRNQIFPIQPLTPTTT